MKIIYTIAVIGVLFLVLFSSGCTSSSPAVQTPTAVPTAVPTTAAVKLAPTQAANPFPNALALNEYATFGDEKQNGKATVYMYGVKPTYSWTDPSWNSPREMLDASQPLELQRGYNLEKPQEGHTFLFIYIRVKNTGQNTIFAPSAKQFVVYTNGQTYSYSSVHGSDVIIDTVSDSQYRYQRGQRDPVEYIQPYDSPLEGYLIYDIPASFSPDTTYVVSNLDYKNSAVWKLG
ncbi:MAG: hypothetical protein WC626_03785 [Methanoregula sp.]